MSINLKTPCEMAMDIAARARRRRLSLNLSQHTLSERSDVSYGTLKKFEQTGKISLESLLKIALVLGAFDDFEHLFVDDKNNPPSSIDELLKENSRKRGSK